MAERVLVTGGLGYLGSIICEHLLDAGFDVTHTAAHVKRCACVERDRIGRRPPFAAENATDDVQTLLRRRHAHPDDAGQRPPLRVPVQS